MGPADAGGALRVRVKDLRRRPGSREVLRRRVVLGGLRVGDAEVAPEPVEVEVALESVSGGVRAQGTIGFSWRGECRRCLGPASGRSDAEVSEVFADDPGSLSAPEAEEALPIEDGWIDLGEVVRDAVALSLPLAPLCRDDCEGPAPAAFPVVVEGAGGVEAEAGTDPRWAALSELRFDPDER